MRRSQINLNSSFAHWKISRQQPIENNAK